MMIESLFVLTDKPVEIAVYNSPSTVAHLRKLIAQVVAELKTSQHNVKTITIILTKV